MQHKVNRRRKAAAAVAAEHRPSGSWWPVGGVRQPIGTTLAATVYKHGEARGGNGKANKVSPARHVILLRPVTGRRSCLFVIRAPRCVKNSPLPANTLLQVDATAAILSDSTASDAQGAPKGGSNTVGGNWPKPAIIALLDGGAGDRLSSWKVAILRCACSAMQAPSVTHSRTCRFAAYALIATARFERDCALGDYN